MNLTIFLYGISAATFAFSGIFFLKFWKASKDRFFLLFCQACWILSFERIVLLWFTSQQVGTHQAEVSTWVYLIRLFAYVLILTAVVIKNRQSRRP